jgi:hypothetical protein
MTINKRNSKQKGQNLFDFVLSNYGSLNYLSLFLQENNLTDMRAFNNAPIGKVFKVTSIFNKVTKTYNNNQYIVRTGAIPKLGDFNIDYNNDFFVTVQ